MKKVQTNMAKKLMVLIAILVTLLMGFIGYTSASADNSNKTADNASISDRIKVEQIQIEGNKLILIYNQDLYLSEYAPTSSMLPVFDKGHNGIEIVPETPKDIKIGDIVAYQSNYVNGLVVHRVIDIKQDNEGIYFVLKGDNNAEQDPEKVKFSQIKYILIGVLY